MKLDHNRIKDEMTDGLLEKLKHYGFIMLDTYKYSILLLIIVIFIIYMYNRSTNILSNVIHVKDIKNMKIDTMKPTAIARIKDRIKGLKLKN